MAYYNGTDEAFFGQVPLPQFRSPLTPALCTPSPPKQISAVYLFGCPLPPPRPHALVTSGVPLSPTSSNCPEWRRAVTEGGGTPRLRGRAQVEDRLVWDKWGAAVEARVRRLTTFEGDADCPER